MQIVIRFLVILLALGGAAGAIFAGLTLRGIVSKNDEEARGTFGVKSMDEILYANAARLLQLDDRLLPTAPCLGN